MRLRQSKERTKRERAASGVMLRVEEVFVQLHTRDV
jgi:hypothetical protein